MTNKTEGDGVVHDLTCPLHIASAALAATDAMQGKPHRV